MPKPGFDLSNPILNLPDEDEESVMLSAINKSRSQNISIISQGQNQVKPQSAVIAKTKLNKEVLEP